MIRVGFANERVGAGGAPGAALRTRSIGCVPTTRGRRAVLLFAVVAAAGVAACSLVQGPGTSFVGPDINQPDNGEGWRLLGATQRGLPFSVRVSNSVDVFAAEWQALRFSPPRPEVDFASETVVTFGQAVSGSCPWVRLDGVTFQPSLVHGNFSTFFELVSPPAPTCTADARPYSFVVALERARLPWSRFTLRLDQRCVTNPCGPQEEIEIELQ